MTPSPSMKRRKAIGMTAGALWPIVVSAVFTAVSLVYMRTPVARLPGPLPPQTPEELRVGLHFLPLAFIFQVPRYYPLGILGYVILI